MKTVFEADVNGEITQVSLWKAYQKQFESYDGMIRAGSVPAMMVAADVIKGTQEAFPTASPKQVEDSNGKRFIISGIKIKSSPSGPSSSALLLAKEREIWKCKWDGCPTAQSPSMLDNAHALYEHLETTHVRSEEGPQRCQFSGCGQIYETPRQMRFHLRTHIPSKTPASPETPATFAHAADALDRMNTFFTQSHHIPQVVNQEYAAGIGFVSSLVVRNCARATSSAALRYRKNAPGGASNSMQIDGGSSNGQSTSTIMNREKNAALDNEEDSVQRRKMFGFLTGSTTEDNSEEKDKDSGDSDIQLTDEQIKNAVNALASVEIDILAVNSANKALAAYLTETLLCIEDAKKAIDGLL